MSTILMSMHILLLLNVKQNEQKNRRKKIIIEFQKKTCKIE